MVSYLNVHKDQVEGLRLLHALLDKVVCFLAIFGDSNICKPLAMEALQGYYLITINVFKLKHPQHHLLIDLIVFSNQYSHLVTIFRGLCSGLLHRS